MNENYQEVPNIISGKDLDYLSDMFNWNYSAYKKTMAAINEVKDETVKSILEKSSNIFHSTMTEILDIMNGGKNE